MGIEPTQPAWKAGALPLSYAGKLAGDDGFEPGTSVLSGLRSKPTELMPVKMVGSKGLEPLCFAALDPESSVSANSTNSP